MPYHVAMTKTQALEWAGGPTELARRLGMAQATVSGWGEVPPYVRQLQIQKLSRGKLKADPLVMPNSTSKA